MSDALVNLQAQANKLTELESAQIPPAVAFGRWMDIKYLAHEAKKSLEDGEYEQAEAILSAQKLAEADQRYGTVR